MMLAIIVCQSNLFVVLFFGICYKYLFCYNIQIYDQVLQLLNIYHLIIHANYKCMLYVRYFIIIKAIDNFICMKT